MAARQARLVRDGEIKVTGDTDSGTVVLRATGAVEQVQVEDHKPDGRGGGGGDKAGRHPGKIL